MHHGGVLDPLTIVVEEKQESLDVMMFLWLKHLGRVIK